MSQSSGFIRHDENWPVNECAQNINESVIQ